MPNAPRPAAHPNLLPPSRRQARHYVLTANNPTLEPEAFAAALEALPSFRYLVFQEERGETGTLHYQAYIEFASSVRGTCFRNVGTPIHFERRRGTRDQARAYPQKEETRTRGPFEHGSWIAGPGTRTDIQTLANFIRAGNNLPAVAEEHPAMLLRYSRGVQLLCTLSQPRRSRPPIVSILYGRPGSGKTRYVFEREGERIFRKLPQCKWFDGFFGQSVALLDDFNGASSKMPLDFLLQILDRYPVNVELKGGSVSFTPERIYITSNIHPQNWYDYGSRPVHYEALARRIHQVIICVTTSLYYLTDHKAFFNPLPLGRGRALHLPCIGPIQ